VALSSGLVRRRTVARLTLVTAVGTLLGVVSLIIAIRGGHFDLLNSVG
jgi:hypothetical protein